MLNDNRLERMKRICLCVVVVLALTIAIPKPFVHAASGAGSYHIGTKNVVDSSSLKYTMSGYVTLSAYTTSKITVSSMSVYIRNLASNPITYALFVADNSSNYMDDEEYFSVTNGNSQTIVADWVTLCSYYGASNTYSLSNSIPACTTINAGPGSYITHGWLTYWYPSYKTTTTH